MNAENGELTERVQELETELSKRDLAEKVAGPPLQQMRARIKELEAEKALLLDECKKCEKWDMRKEIEKLEAENARLRSMTVPPKQLLKQLKGEVEWLRKSTLCFFAEDHADAAFDIIEELEQRYKQNEIELLVLGAIVDWYADYKEEMELDLRRLHDLIKGAACHEAMRLVERLAGME